MLPWVPIGLTRNVLVTSVFVSKGCYATTLANVRRYVHGFACEVYFRAFFGGRSASYAFPFLDLYPGRLFFRANGLTFRARVLVLRALCYVYYSIRLYEGLRKGLVVLLVRRVRVVRGAFATSRLRASAVVRFRCEGGLRRSGLAYVYRVDSAAYARVGAERDRSAGLSYRFFLASMVGDFRFLDVEVDGCGFPVLPRSLVCFPLGFYGLQIVRRAVRVCDSRVTSRVRACVVVAVLLVGGATSRVLAKVLLRRIGATHPIGLSLGLHARFRDLVDVVGWFSVFLVGLYRLYVPRYPRVA